MVLAYWLAMKTYHRADADTFLQRVLPMIRGGQQVMGALTVGYIQRLVATLSDNPVSFHGLSAAEYSGAVLRGGVPMNDVYLRPFYRLWAALAADQPLAQAVESAGARLRVLVATDLQLAKTHAARAAMRSEGVVGYRRVPDAGACDLCLVAATQRYRSKDLMPIHPNCRCDVAPILGSRDPGRVISRQLKPTEPVEVAVHQNAGIGPVLTVKGQHFEGDH
jgi:hypothetical protein